MNTGSIARSALSGIALAVPFVVLSLWLGWTIPAFGVSLVVQGVLFAFVLATTALLLSRCLGRWGAALSLMLYLLALVLWFAASVSWFMQGSSFNERFFVHLNVDNVQVSFEAYPWAFVGVAAAVVLLMTGAGWLLLRMSRQALTPLALLFVVVFLGVLLMLHAPPHQLYAYLNNAERSQQLAGSSAAARIRAMLDLHPSRPDEVRATPGRNLVFIYLESVERTYTDGKRFPGLTPNIDRLRHQGLDFSGFETFPGITYTIAGLFSSECGAPYLINTIFGDDFGKLGFVPNNDNTTASSFHPELACLGDVLHVAGYDQTYLSGVTLEFANTDVFFKMHQYSRALGKPQIEKLYSGKLPTEGWGLRDDDMFKVALDEYRKKEAAGKPFTVVLSTMDTHPPEGYVLPECKHYKAIQNAMLDAIHCADQLVGRFINALSHEPGWANTVVVVMSDHVSMRNVASPLYPPDDQRQPLLFIVNAGSGVRAARMYHMDIAPTVLALLDVHSNVRFMAGADRSKPNSPGTKLPATDVAKAVLREELWKQRKPPEICSDGTLVQWNGKGGFDFGGWNLPLMLGGYPINAISESQTMLIFKDKHSAQLQVLSRGEQLQWQQRARQSGGSIFEATPFRDEQGRHMLALDWLTPQGGWASLGAVTKMQDIKLKTPQCSALLRKLNAAKTGARLDFSAAFGTQAVPAVQERRPGFVMSLNIAEDASPKVSSSFMFARLTNENPGYDTVHINVKNRITIMPGQNHPASATFDVSGLASLQLVPRVDNLFGVCRKHKDTGIVGVRVYLDGRLLTPRFIVDRNYKQVLDVPTTEAHLLRIDVDKGNSTSACDYFAMGFSGIEPETPSSSADGSKTSNPR